MTELHWRFTVGDNLWHDRASLAVAHKLFQALTHWGLDKMADISQTTFSNAFSWIEIYQFRFIFHWSLFLRVELTIFQHRLRWLAWRRPGDKPLSEPMLISLPTHICVTRPQWVKWLSTFCLDVVSCGIVSTILWWTRSGEASSRITSWEYLLIFLPWYGTTELYSTGVFCIDWPWCAVLME